jgi:hypothetical protein
MDTRRKKAKTGGGAGAGAGANGASAAPPLPTRKPAVREFAAHVARLPDKHGVHALSRADVSRDIRAILGEPPLPHVSATRRLAARRGAQRVAPVLGLPLPV